MVIKIWIGDLKALQLRADTKGTGPLTSIRAPSGFRIVLNRQLESLQSAASVGDIPAHPTISSHNYRNCFGCERTKCPRVLRR